MNRENLLKLANYLYKGKLKSRFDMSTYGDSSFSDNCGTCGCAVGHGPFAGILKSFSEDWTTYCERVFGIDDCSDEYEWMFDCDWTSIDNTYIGAAKRIFWIIEKGLPGNHKRILLGLDPICYNDQKPINN